MARNQQSEPLIVAFAADSGVRHGLLVALGSLLRFHPQRRMTIHLIDGGLPAGTRCRAKRLVRRHGNARLERHAIDPTRLAGLPPGPNGSAMPYGRLLLGSLLPDAERVLYLDTDVLVCACLEELWETQFSDSEIVAGVADPFLPFLKDDCPVKLRAEEEGMPYVNTGVLLMNLERWREEDCEQTCFAVLAEHGRNCPYFDQTAINYVCRGRIHLVDRSWNHTPLSSRAAPSDPRCVHFFGFPNDGESPPNGGSCKPWDWWAGRPEYEKWRAEARRAGLSPLLMAIGNPRVRGVWLTKVVLDLAKHHFVFRKAIAVILRARAVHTNDPVKRRTTLRLLADVNDTNRTKDISSR